MKQTHLLRKGQLMKCITLLMLAAVFTIQVVEASSNIDIVRVPIRKAYLPVGFDNNDRSEIFVSGDLPDLCHRIGDYKVNVDEKTQTVRVEQYAIRHPGPCPDMIVPFAHVIHLGIMSRGNYRVMDATSGDELGSFPIVEATKPMMDDFLYMPLTNAYAKEDPTTHEASVILEGNYYDRCTKYKETRIHYYSEVIVIQPIAEAIQSRNCTGEPTRFQISVPLKKGLKGSFLIHVRSMSGEAVNSLYNFVF